MNKEDMALNLAQAAGTLALMTAQTPGQMAAAQNALGGLQNQAAQLERKRVEKERKKQKKKGIINEAASIAGSVGGFMVGGPPGAAVGSGLARTASGAAQGESLDDAAIAGLIDGGVQYGVGKLADLGANALKGATTAGGTTSVSPPAASGGAGEVPGSGALEKELSDEMVNDIAANGGLGKVPFKEKLADAITQPDTVRGLTGLARSLQEYNTAPPEMSTNLLPLRFDDQQAIRRDISIQDQQARQEQFQRERASTEDAQFQQQRMDRKEEAATDRAFRRDQMYEKAGIDQNTEEFRFMYDRNLREIDHLNDLEKMHIDAVYKDMADDKKFDQMMQIEGVKGSVRVEIANARAQAKAAEDAAKRNDPDTYMNKKIELGRDRYPEDPDLARALTDSLIQADMQSEDPAVRRAAETVAGKLGSAGTVDPGSRALGNPVAVFEYDPNTGKFNQGK